MAVEFDGDCMHVPHYVPYQQELVVWLLATKIFGHLGFMLVSFWCFRFLGSTDMLRNVCLKSLV